MSHIRHPNIVMFMGLCLNPVCVITEFCARGSLLDVLKKAATSATFAQQMDWPRRLSMAMDAAKVAHLILHRAAGPIRGTALGFILRSDRPEQSMEMA